MKISVQKCIRIFYPHVSNFYKYGFRKKYTALIQYFYNKTTIFWVITINENKYKYKTINIFFTSKSGLKINKWVSAWKLFRFLNLTVNYMRKKIYKKGKIMKEKYEFRGVYRILFLKIATASFLCPRGKTIASHAELSIAMGRTLKSEGKNSQKQDAEFFLWKVWCLPFLRTFWPYLGYFEASTCPCTVHASEYDDKRKYIISIQYTYIQVIITL